jgi:hypothetical protein
VINDAVPSGAKEGQMAKDGGKRKERGKERPKKGSVASASVAGSTVAVVASSMGAASLGPIAARPALPQTREELMELWQEARRRRHSAPLDSEAYVQASQDVARIEVEIAAVERALTPPLV